MSMRYGAWMASVVLVSSGLAAASHAAAPAVDKKHSLRLAAGAPGERRVALACDAARPLACGARLDSTNAGAPDLANAYGCADFDESGGDVVYRLELASTAEITIRVTGMTADLDLFLLAGCDAGACLAASTSVGPEALVHCLDAGVYFLVVDGYDGASSAFHLELDCAPCVPCAPAVTNDRCSGALLIPHASSWSQDGDTRCAADDYSDPACTGYSARGHDVAYRIVLPPGCRIQAVLRDGPDGLPVDRSMSLVADCADPAGTCVAGADRGVVEDEVLEYESSPGGIFYLLVDAFGDGAAGDYRLEITQTNCSVVGVARAGWQDVKRLYR